MTEIFLIKHADGALRPASEEDAELLRRWKIGEPVKVEAKKPRNYKLLQKTMVLFRLAYEHFCEFNVSEVTYKGQRVVPCKDRFRKDLTILAGHYDAVFDIRGGVRLSAKSLSYARCSEEQAQEIYQSIITAALANVYRGRMSEEQLQRAVDDILRFA